MAANNSTASEHIPSLAVQITSESVKAIGLTSNTLLVLIVLFGLKKVNSIFITVLCHSIVDIVNILRSFLKSYWMVSLVNLRELRICKAILWVDHTFPLMSHWIMVLIATERVISMYFKYKAKSLVNSKMICIIIAVMAVMCAAFGIVMTFSIGEVDRKCDRVEGELMVTGVIFFFFMIVVPVPTTLVFNVLVCVKFWLHKRAVPGSGSGQVRHAKLTPMLLTANIFFIISLIPIMIKHMAALDEESKLILNDWARLALNLNYSIHFLFYISLSQAVRHGFLRLLRKCRCWRKTKKNKVHPQQVQMTNRTAQGSTLQEGGGGGAGGTTQKSGIKAALKAEGSTTQLDSNEVRNSKRRSLKVKSEIQMNMTKKY